MTRDKFPKAPVGQASVPVTTEENKELVERASLQVERASLPAYFRQARRPVLPYLSFPLIW